MTPSSYISDALFIQLSIHQCRDYTSPHVYNKSNWQLQLSGRSKSSTAATIGNDCRSMINRKEVLVAIHDVLHLLPIQQRIKDNLYNIVCNAMHHTAPVYLTNPWWFVNTPNSANLRSSARGEWSVAANKGASYGRRSYCCIWSHNMEYIFTVNSWTISEFQTVCSRLKTELFNWAYYVA